MVPPCPSVGTKSMEETDTGFVYILANNAMPGLVKIGFSGRAPEERATELSTTGVPLPFTVVYAAQVAQPSMCESHVHSNLASLRVAPNREFFRISVSAAIAVVEDVSARLGLKRTPVQLESPYRGPLLGYNLSPMAPPADPEYFEAAVQYYPGIPTIGADEASGVPTRERTWYPDQNISKTEGGTIHCPSCDGRFRYVACRANGFLPPVTVPCERCGRTIFIA